MPRIELLERAKPILFNTEMVRAIQDGRKTVTRRLVKYKYKKSHLDYDRISKSLLEVEEDIKDETYGTYPNGEHWHRLLNARKILPQYKVGDILYVRETWCRGNFRGEEERYYYRADNKIPHCEWHPSIHMPKEAARIFLRVINVTPQRLKEITKEHAKAEGFASRFEFITTFLRMYPNCTENDWVWVIELERME